MSFDGLLTHECDLYHYQQPGQQQQFGRAVQVPGRYPSAPDVVAARCYWEEDAQDIQLGEPNATIMQRFTVFFPPGVDVRRNDRAVRNGVRFRLLEPQDIRGHHWEVVAIREDTNL